MPNTWAIICTEPKLQARFEFKEILPHKSSGNWLTTGHAFNSSFIKETVKIGFDGRHHARTGQSCQVRRNCVIILLDEQRFSRCVSAIVAHHVPNAIYQGRFAGVAWPVYEK